MQSALSTSRVASGAMFGLLAVLSNPDYYLWVLAPLGFAVFAYRSFTVPNNKRVFLVSCVAFALYAFGVGRIMFVAHQLTSNGVVAIMGAALLAGYLSWRFYKTEASAA